MAPLGCHGQGKSSLMKRNLATMQTVVQGVKTPTFQFTMVQHNGTFFRPQLKKKLFVSERFSKSYQIYFCFRSNLLNSERKKVFSLRRNKKILTSWYLIQKQSNKWLLIPLPWFPSSPDLSLSSWLLPQCIFRVNWRMVYSLSLKCKNLAVSRCVMKLYFLKKLITCFGCNNSTALKQILQLYGCHWINFHLLAASIL